MTHDNLFRLGALAAASLTIHVAAQDPMPWPTLEASLKQSRSTLELQLSSEGGPARWCMIVASADGVGSVKSAHLPQLLWQAFPVAVGLTRDGRFRSDIQVPSVLIKEPLHLQAATFDGTAVSTTAVLTVGEHMDGIVHVHDVRRDRLALTPGGPLDRIENELVATESIPPQYSLMSRFDADCDGYRLWRAEVRADGNGTDVYLALKTPGENEGLLDIAERFTVGTHLGAYPGDRVRVYAAETQVAHHEGPLLFHLIDAFDVPGTGPVGNTDGPAGRTDNRHLATKPSAWLDGIDVQLIPTDSIPPQWTVRCGFEARTDGFALAKAEVRGEGGQDVTEVYMSLKVPGPGEGHLDVHQSLSADAHLGASPGRVIRVYGAASVVPDENAKPAYQLLREFTFARRAQPGAQAVDWLDRIRCNLYATKSIPPQYSLMASFLSNSDGFGLLRGQVRRVQGVSEVYLTLKTPGEGEGHLDLAQQFLVGANLGIDPGTAVQVFAAQTQDLQNEGELAYRKIAEFAGVGAGSQPRLAPAGVEGGFEGWLRRLEIELTSTDGIPPEYSLLAGFEAISDGFGLHLWDVAQQNGNSDIYLILKVPGKGEGTLDVVEWHRLGVELGRDPGREVRIFAAESDTIEAGGNHKFEMVKVIQVRP